MAVFRLQYSKFLVTHFPHYKDVFPAGSETAIYLFGSFKFGKSRIRVSFLVNYFIPFMCAGSRQEVNSARDSDGCTRCFMSPKQGSTRKPKETSSVYTPNQHL